MTIASTSGKSWREQGVAEFHISLLAGERNSHHLRVYRFRPTGTGEHLSLNTGSNKTRAPLTSPEPGNSIRKQACPSQVAFSLL
jgi:hypothetical protein